MDILGLPTAALIASRGIQVHGVDVSEKIVKMTNEGRVHIVEPDLEGLVHHVVKKGYLKASSQPKEADVFLITVPTPFKIKQYSFVPFSFVGVKGYRVKG